MRPNLSAFALTTCLASLPLAASAKTDTPQFARIFANHAVLQRDEPVHIWGTAHPATNLIVSFGGQTVSVLADENGRWSTHLSSLPAGATGTLSVKDDSGNGAELSDVVAGDVFLCGGQSNMEFPARLATGALTDIGASANNEIRFVNIPTSSELLPLPDLKEPAEWLVASPVSIGKASAVCYYMAKDLNKSQKVPIGLIDSYWGGTAIQSWISGKSLSALANYSDGVDAVKTYASSPSQGLDLAAMYQSQAWESLGNGDASSKWSATKLKDNTWPAIDVGTSWKVSGVPDLQSFDGVVWFRTTISLSAADAKLANTLRLGFVDQFDTTWINGQWVGSAGVAWVPRSYAVPAGVFKPGKNVIAVRIVSGKSAGGFTDSASSRSIRLSDGRDILLPAKWKYKTEVSAFRLQAPSGPWEFPTSLNTLYNGMISPIKGYTIKLVAWYQGEANGQNGKEYETLLPLMMADWRETFSKPDLPFLVAQLANYGPVATQPVASRWAELREAQRVSVEKDPHSALITTIDVGDRYDVHPSQKAVVGNRFARAARTLIYGSDQSPSGPEATRVDVVGADLIISFKSTHGKLLAYSSNRPIGFEICSGDQCAFADATIRGDKIVLENANRPDVTAVRYAWADAPYVNLYSDDDMPAVPFQLPISR